MGPGVQNQSLFLNKNIVMSYILAHLRIFMRGKRERADKQAQTGINNGKELTYKSYGSLGSVKVTAKEAFLFN